MTKTATTPQTGDTRAGFTRLSVADLVARAVDPIAALDKLGTWFGRSGFFGCDRLEAGAVVALTCVTEGLSPAEFARIYHVVGGKMVKRAEAAFADFRARGGRLRWTEDGSDGKAAAAVFTFDGKEVPFRYSMEDATRAGLVKAGSGWTTRPANMLRAAVIRNGVRMVAPEVFGGEYEDDGAPYIPPPGLSLATVGDSVANVVAEAPPAPVDAAQAPPAPATPADPAKRRGRPPKAEAAATPPPPPQAPPAAQAAAAGEYRNESGAHQAHVLPGNTLPTPPPAPEPPKDAAPPAQVQADPLANPPELSNEKAEALLAAIGDSPENLTKARNWLVSKGWLMAGVPLECLPEAVADKILAKADRFREAAGITLPNPVNP